MAQNIFQIIRNMPKVELHLHLEGAFTFENLYSLIEKYGGDPNIKNIDELRNFFTFKDFPHFLKTWYWKNRFFREPEDFENSTYHTIKNLAEQNVVYAEVFYSPWDFEPNGLKVEEITEATISGIQKAETEYKIKIGLIADIVRNYGAEGSLKRLFQVTPFLNRGIIGLGLGGDEKGYPAEDFQVVFKKAKDAGFRLTAHAGEADGPNSVKDAILKLGVERIGHGVRAVEDDDVINIIKEKNIPLEVCITSNICTKIYSSVEDHPFKKMFEQGIIVTLNSDDPPMFGANITDEFLLVADKLNFCMEDVKLLSLNAVNASFLDQDAKTSLRNSFEKYWTNLL